MSLNGEKLLSKMSDVDESLILAAENPRRSKRLLIKTGIITSAAVAAAAAVVLNLIPQNGNWAPLSSDELPELPSLNIGVYDESHLLGQGMEALETSELKEAIETGEKVNRNFNIREMPVYSCGSADPDIDQMRARLREVAEYFGVDYDSMDIYENITDERSIRDTFEPLGAPEEEIQRILRQLRSMTYISANEQNEEGWTGMNFFIGPDLCVDINLTRPNPDEGSAYENVLGGIELPEEYSFDPDASREEQEKTGRYLLERFSGLIDMKDPVFVMKSPYSGSFSYAEFYEKGETDAESIANQSIKLVTFSGTDDGRLSSIRIWEEYRHCEKIADYPINNLEQAKEQLKNGNCLTSVPYDVTGEEKIGLVELTYRSGSGYSCVMPFYRFYVKLPEEKFEGINPGESLYGAFYVPAVRSEYLEGLDSPAISFNGAMITE